MTSFRPTKEELLAQKDDWLFNEAIVGASEGYLHFMVLWEYARESSLICGLVEEVGRSISKIQREVQLVEGRVMVPTEIIGNLIISAGASPAGMNYNGARLQCQDAYQLAQRLLGLIGRQALPLLLSTAFPGFSWSRAVREDARIIDRASIPPYGLPNKSDDFNIIELNGDRKFQITKHSSSSVSISLECDTPAFYEFLESLNRPLRCNVKISLVPKLQNEKCDLVDATAQTVCHSLCKGNQIEGRHTFLYDGCLGYQSKAIEFSVPETELESIIRNEYSAFIIPEEAISDGCIAEVYRQIARRRGAAGMEVNQFLKVKTSCQMLKDLSAYRTFNAGLSLSNLEHNSELENNSELPSNKWNPNYQSRKAWRERAEVVPRNFESLYPSCVGSLLPVSDVMWKVEKQSSIERKQGKQPRADIFF